MIKNLKENFIKLVIGVVAITLCWFGFLMAPTTQAAEKEIVWAIVDD